MFSSLRDLMQNDYLDPRYPKNLPWYKWLWRKLTDY